MSLMQIVPLAKTETGIRNHDFVSFVLVWVSSALTGSIEGSNRRFASKRRIEYFQDS